jgi:hypothetical protein
MIGNKIPSALLLMEGLHYFDSCQTGLFLITTGKPYQNTIFEFFGS